MLCKVVFCQQCLPSYYLTWTLLLTLLARFVRDLRGWVLVRWKPVLITEGKADTGKVMPWQQKNLLGQTCCFNDVLCGPKFCLLQPRRHSWLYVALSSPPCLLQLLSVAQGSHFSLVLHTTHSCVPGMVQGILRGNVRITWSSVRGSHQE